MKPMLLLIAVGVGFTVWMYTLGADSYEGVVATKTYETSLNYEEDYKNIQSLKDVLVSIDNKFVDSNLVVNFVIDPTKSEYDTLDVINVVLQRPMGEDILLSKEDNGYTYGGNINNGWYNLKIIVDADSKPITITKSIYIES